jgi:hypothetical protein
MEKPVHRTYSPGRKRSLIPMNDDRALFEFAIGWNSGDVNKASNIKAKAGWSKAKDLTIKAKAIDININEAFNAKVK